MKRLTIAAFAAASAWLVASAPALAQSNPCFNPGSGCRALQTGDVPSAAQWNSFYTAKQDTLTNGSVLGAWLASGAAAANLGFTPLAPANNLSDVGSAASARGHLGLGDLATVTPASGISAVLGNAPNASGGLLTYGVGYSAMTGWGSGVSTALGVATNAAGGLVTSPVAASNLASGSAAANLGFTPLDPARNLSDVGSAASARLNLQLGALSTATPGTGVTTAVGNATNGAGGLVTSPVAASNLASGAAVASLGFTPLDPANNLSDVNASAARSNLGLGALATTAPGAGVSTALSLAANASGGVVTSPVGNSNLASGAAVANLGFTPLAPANNLSDVNAVSARSNLGLGGLATVAPGSGVADALASPANGGGGPVVMANVVADAFAATDAVIAAGSTVLSSASKSCGTNNGTADAGKTIIVAGAGSATLTPLVTTIASCSGANFVLAAPNASGYSLPAPVGTVNGGTAAAAMQASWIVGATTLTTLNVSGYGWASNVSTSEYIYNASGQKVCKLASWTGTTLTCASGGALKAGSNGDTLTFEINPTAAAGSWTTGTTITMPNYGSSYSVPLGANVWDMTTNRVVGVVAGWSGTTLTLAAAAANPGSTSDTLAFYTTSGSWAMGTDNTAALVNFVTANPDDEVVLPAGGILLTNKIAGVDTPVPLNRINLRGRGIIASRRDTLINAINTGTIFYPVSTTASPFTILNGTRVTGVNFFWPGQMGDGTAPIAYPGLFSDAGQSIGQFQLDHDNLLNVYDIYNQTYNATTQTSISALKWDALAPYCIHSCLHVGSIGETADMANFDANPNQGSSIFSFNNNMLRQWGELNGAFIQQTGLGIAAGTFTGYIDNGTPGVAGNVLHLSTAPVGALNPAKGSSLSSGTGAPVGRTQTISGGGITGAHTISALAGGTLDAPGSTYIISGTAQRVGTSGSPVTISNSGFCDNSAQVGIHFANVSAHDFNYGFQIGDGTGTGGAEFTESNVGMNSGSLNELVDIDEASLVSNVTFLGYVTQTSGDNGYAGGPISSQPALNIRGTCPSTLGNMTLTGGVFVPGGGLVSITGGALSNMAGFSVTGSRIAYAVNPISGSATEPAIAVDSTSLHLTVEGNSRIRPSNTGSAYSGVVLTNVKTAKIIGNTFDSVYNAVDTSAMASGSVTISGNVAVSSGGTYTLNVPNYANVLLGINYFDKPQPTLPIVVTYAQSPYTFTPPAGMIYADVTLVGGGSGGGGGAEQASGAACSGGGGGGAGSRTFGQFTSAAIGASQTVTIGAGGSGGLAASGTSSAGGTGGDGGNTTFGSLMTAFHGGAGSGGQLAGNSAGGGGGGITTTGGDASGSTAGSAGQGGGAGGSGAAGANLTTNGGGSGGSGGVNGAAGITTGQSILGPSGGGSGGGISAGNSPFTGGSGGKANGIAGGVNGIPGLPGTSPTTATQAFNLIVGSGGGGGDAHLTAPGVGGAGGVPGGGGGGAGCTQNGGTPAAGGAGGAGGAVIVPHIAP